MTDYYYDLFLLSFILAVERNLIELCFREVDAGLQWPTEKAS